MDPSPTAVDATMDVRSVTYRMTPDDAYRVSRMMMPRWVPMGIGVGAVLLFLAAAVLVISGEVGIGLGLVIGAVLVLATRPLMRWVAIRRISTRLAKLPGPVILTIEPDGIHAARGQSSSLVAWTDVVSVGTRGPFVWVQGRVGPVFAVPRRAFSSDADIQGFVSAANGFLAGSARA